MTNGMIAGLALAMGAAGAALAGGPAETGTAAAIDRARAVEPRIHSIIALDPTAIEQARSIDSWDSLGPLEGVPVLIKDNIETAGPLPTTAGSLALKDNVSGRDAPLVARLRGAGAVILGKANLSEWANIRSTNSISGWSAIGGQTRNPYALDRNPCGSSSGSGAAVAAGIVDHAIGTETDGSITCPAAINGIVGFKPTVGLVSRNRIIPISVSQDTAGPMTRTVRQSAELLTVIAGSDPADTATREADKRKVDYAAALGGASLKGKRLGVMRFASGFGTDPAFDAALALLKREGAVLVEIKSFDDKAIGANELHVLLTEFKAGLNDYLATTPPAVKTRTLAEVIAFNQATPREMALFGQELFEQAEKTKGLKDPAYLKARRLSFMAAGPNGIDRLMRLHRLDALVGPTMPAAWLIDVVHGDQISGGGAGSLAAVAGYPHLTVPMGMVKGLPVGLSFIGPKWQDAKVLALGHAYEQARGALPAPRMLPTVEANADAPVACASAGAGRGDIKRAIEAFYAALAKNDATAYAAATADNFHAYEVGRRYTGQELFDIISKAHREGKTYVWNVGEVDAQVDCNIATAAWQTSGAAGVSPKLEPRSWLESGIFVWEGGRWVLAFLHSTPSGPRP